MNLQCYRVCPTIRGPQRIRRLTHTHRNFEIGWKKTRQHIKCKNRGPERLAKWRILKGKGLVVNENCDLGCSKYSLSCFSSSAVEETRLDSNQSVTGRRIVDTNLFCWTAQNSELSKSAIWLLYSKFGLKSELKHGIKSGFYLSVICVHQSKWFGPNLKKMTKWK